MKLVAGVATAALTLAVLSPAPSASAAVAHVAQLTHRHGLAPQAGCEPAYPASASAPVTSVPLPTSGGAASHTTNRSGALMASGGGTYVAGITSTVASNVSFTTSGGGLSALALSTSAAAAFTRPEPSPACGSNGLVAEATSESEYGMVLPVAAGGWLDLAASAPGQRGPEDRYRYEVYVAPPGGDLAPVAANPDVLGNVSTRVYLPAGGSLGLVVSTKVEAELRYPDNGRRSASGGMSLRASFTPGGVAATLPRGPRLARRAVALPPAVSCAGSAHVRVTRFARKNATAVVLLVNGQRVKRIPRVRRARTYVIPVPVAGPITIAAKVTPKKGAKRLKAVRSYVACR